MGSDSALTPPLLGGDPILTSSAAAVYDSVVAPKWATLFGRALIQRVPLGQRGQLLDLACGSGYPAVDILKRIAEAGRIIAIDRETLLVELARRRTLEESGRRIFFKVESPEELGFGDDVFDLAIGNLALGRVLDEEAALTEIKRVLIPGARVVLSRAMRDTFGEVLDMFREARIRAPASELGARLEMLEARYPTVEDVRDQLARLGYVDIDVRVEDHRLPFHSPRELFADPMIRAVASPEWKWLSEGAGEHAADVMKGVERALDIYFAGGPVSLTVKTGLIEAKKPAF